MAMARSVSRVCAVLSVAIGAVVAAHEAHSQDRAAPRRRVVQAIQPFARGALVLTITSKADQSRLSRNCLVRTTGGQIHTWEGTANDEGQYSIVPPREATDGFDVIVASAGYAPRRLASSAIAAEHTMKLEPAEKIGGIVRDESGQPIAGRGYWPRLLPS